MPSSSENEPDIKIRNSDLPAEAEAGFRDFSFLVKTKKKLHRFITRYKKGGHLQLFKKFAVTTLVTSVNGRVTGDSEIQSPVSTLPSFYWFTLDQALAFSVLLFSLVVQFKLL